MSIFNQGVFQLIFNVKLSAGGALKKNQRVLLWNGIKSGFRNDW